MERSVFRGSAKHPQITFVDALILTQLLPDHNGDNFAEVVQALKLAGSENPAADAYSMISAYAAYSAAACGRAQQPYPQSPDIRLSETYDPLLSAEYQPCVAIGIGYTCDMRGALRQLATRFMASA